MDPTLHLVGHDQKHRDLVIFFPLRGEAVGSQQVTVEVRGESYYALGHRINNLKLHNSALSLIQATKGSSADEEGSAVIRLGASPTDDEQPMIRALYGAMFTYGRIAKLVISETGGNIPAWDTFYSQQLDVAYKLAPSRRNKIGRNEPCPCGSGKKFKVCHVAAM